MAELKPGWQRVKFGDVVRLNKETCKNPEAEGIERVIGLEHLEPGDLRIRSWGDVADGTTFTKRVRPGQVLFGKRRAYQRKVAVADCDAICSGDIYVFETKDETHLTQELLPFVCQTDSFFKYAVGTSAGSLSPRTNWGSLAAYEFFLPPLEEQMRIVALLKATADADRAWKTARDNLRLFRKAYTTELFPDARTRTSSPCKAVSKNHPTVHGLMGGLYDPNGALAQLRTTDIDDEGNIDYSAIPLVCADPQENLNHLLEDGDLVISRSGTCGITAIFKGHSYPTVAAAFLVRLRLNEMAVPEYIHEYLSSPVGRALSESLSRGGVQKNLNASELLRQPVPLPSVSDQADMVSRIQKIRVAESEIEVRINRLSNLFANALSRLLLTPSV
jgi:type I restriction enzyme S subunit